MLLAAHERRYYNSVHRHNDDRFVKSENLSKLKSVGSWDYYGICRNMLVWIPALACARIVPVSSLHIWQLAREARHQDLLHYFHKTVCGLGRTSPLFSDLSLVSIFPGEFNLKALLANWHSSSNCQLLQMQYQTEAYKITMVCSSAWNDILYFPIQYCA